MKQADINVLIIDGDTQHSEAISRNLGATEEAHFTVTIAGTAREASAAMAEHRYDCLLMNTNLPDAKGLDLLLNGEFKDLSVIMMADRMDTSDAMQSMLRGALDYLVKEFIRPDLLGRTIQYLLKKREAFEISLQYRSFIETLLDAIPYPFYYKDKVGMIIGCNGAFEKMIGLPGSGIIGRIDRDLFTVNTEMLESEHEIDGEKTVNSFFIETDIRTFRGESYNVLYHCGHFKTRDGTSEGILCIMADITGMKNIERELRTFRMAVEQSLASIVITDARGVIEYVNPRFTEVTGYSSDEAIGRTSNILKSGEHSEEFYREMWHTILSGKKWRGEIRNIRKNGELFWELSSISPILDDRGEIKHFLAVKEDISSMKRMEGEMKETDEKLHVLFESLAEGIAVVDMAGTVLQVNRSFSEQHRSILAEDPYQKSIDRLLPPWLTAQLRGGMAEARLKGESGIAEYRIPGPGDSENEMEMVVATLRDKNSNPWGYVITTKEMSERKAAERALRESEERNREILESIPDLMFKMDSSGNYREPTLVPKVKRVFPPEIVKKALPVIAETLESGEICMYEYPVYSEGDLQYYEARFIVSGTEEVLVILRNITDRIIADEQLKKARDDAESANRAKSEFLAHMSHEIRTPLNSILGFIELLQRSRLDSVQSEYLDIVTTSAQNLLGIINDVLDFSKIESKKMTIDEVPFDPLKEFESVINLFTVKASQKEIGLLTYIDPNLPSTIIGDPLRIKQVLMNLLGNAIKFTPVKGTIKLEITTEQSDDAYCNIHFAVRDNGIGIDENKIKKIFEAFSQADSSIARKYGGTGLGLSISANLLRLMASELKLESEKGKWSNFHFTTRFKIGQTNQRYSDDIDTGRFNTVLFLHGGASSELEEYLDRYLHTFGFRVSAIRSVEGIHESKADVVVSVYSREATEEWYRTISMEGLLPMVLIADENDRFDIDSHRKYIGRLIMNPVNPSKLHSAIVDLVTKVPDAAALQRDEIPVRLSYASRVLLAEDNAINQKLFILMLREFGIEAVLARNGLEAIEKYESGSFDIVLMDINMPIYDGVEAAHMMREYEEKHTLSHVPIIALTAKAMKGDRESLLNSGFDDYLSKPLAIDDLGRVLERFCLSQKNTVMGSAVELQKTAQSVYEHDTYSIEATAKKLGIPMDVLRGILKEFFDTTGTYTDEIRESIASGDNERLSLSAHKLKGIAANLQLSGLAELASTIEQKAEERSDADFQTLFEQLNDTIHQLSEDLSRYLE